MRTSHRITLLALALLTAPITASGQAVADPAAAIRKASDEVWAKVAVVARKGDAAGIAALYTTDGISIEAAAPTKVGRANIEAATREMFKTAKMLDVGHKVDAIEAAGDLAFESGIETVVVQEKGKPQATTQQRYLIVWKKVGGVWLVRVAMSDAPTEAKPAAPRKGS